MGVFTVRPSISASPPSAGKPAHESSRQRDGRPAELLVEAERLGERPAVLEGMESAGVMSGPGGVSVGARPSIHAKYARPSNEGIVGAEPLPGMRARPDEPGAARTEQPLVAPGDEDVGAELDGRGVLDAEAVHPVDAQEDPFVVGAPRFASATASAISRSGSFTPVDECTQVSARQRGRGAKALEIAETISSTEADSGWS